MDYSNLSGPDSLAARYLVTFFLAEFIGLTAICTDKLKIEAADVQILACITYFSFQKAFNEPVDKGAISTENFNPDQIVLKPVNAKSIYLTLGMSRETVRRRLIFLASRGLFEKVDGGYIFPVQSGVDDVYRPIRAYMFEMAKRVQQRLNQIMPDEA